MRSRKRTLLVATLALLLLVAVASAYGLTIRAGDLVLNADGGFSPTALPRHENAPITLHGGGELSTVSGDLPPIVETLDIEFDRHGEVQTTGLEVCTAGKLQATTVPAARRACPDAIVGKGKGSAIVKFPEQAPIPISSPITIFNGPRRHGDDTVLAHFYTTVPVVTTFIVPVVIEKIHKGVYGYRTIAKIPEIAGGAGHPISGSLKIGRNWTYKGVSHSYVNARCESGHLQARVEVKFKDEGAGATFLTGTFLKPCTVRH
ncbi:MAG TPA: hypothetical protein VH275_11620 [Solirubrobacterales bacterium]|jgi:hypothetical protein|nr:hypothetical protein [Solirubrobacterales bacterium]